MKSIERLIMAMGTLPSQVGGKVAESITRKAFLTGLALTSLGLLPRPLVAGGGEGTCQDCCHGDCCDPGEGDYCPPGWEWAEGDECGCSGGHVCWNPTWVMGPECGNSACCDCKNEEGDCCAIFAQDGGT